VGNNIVMTKEQLEEAGKRLCAADTIGVDLETTGFDFWKDSIVGFALGDSEERYYIPSGKELSAFEINRTVTDILGCLNDKVFHNGKFDLQFLFHNQFKVNGALHDTMVQAHLLDENRKSKKLKDLGAQYVRKDAAEGEAVLKTYFKKHELDHYGQIPLEIIGPYACVDIELTMGLHNKFYPKVLAEFEELYENEMALLYHLTKMEMRGVVVDVEYMTSFQKECEDKLLKVQNDIFKVAGHTFNINSGDELANVLFTELGLPAVDFSAKTGKPCMDKFTLHKLQGKHTIIDHLLEYRSLSKLASTYITGILNKVTQGNIIHADFQQVGTTTGRLSCWSPNLHNIPRGDVIRKAFLNPDPNNAQLLFADYSQIEFRMLAHYSKDPIMIEGFKTGADFHTWTGMKLFNLPAEELTKEHRIKAKQINFGIVYGMGTKTLASKLGVTQMEAKKFLDDYHDAFPGLRAFIWAARSAVKQRGYIKNFLGRHRRLESRENYKAVNALCQGSAADVLKIALNRVAAYLEDKKSYPIMNIHDEIVIVHYLDEPEVIGAVKELMEDFSFRVPLLVEMEYSKTNWGKKQKEEI
jgi:DNA polymerase I